MGYGTVSLTLPSSQAQVLGWCLGNGYHRSGKMPVKAHEINRSLALELDYLVRKVRDCSRGNTFTFTFTTTAC